MGSDVDIWDVMQESAFSDLNLWAMCLLFTVKNQWASSRRNEPVINPIKMLKKWARHLPVDMMNEWAKWTE